MMLSAKNAIEEGAAGMGAPRLSICIPVFNFGAFLGETLDSILPQATTEVEILVVDGASTDNTQEIVAARAATCTQLRYVKLEKRGGIDADLAVSVALARGQYCWLFSGDDIMRPHAIRHLLEWLRENHDVYICKHTICDKNMRVLRDYPVFRDDRLRRVEMSDPSQRRQWLSEGINTEALFSFMSSIIVRREKWLFAQTDEKFMGSCWAHVARLLLLAQSQLKVCYVAEVWLDKRGDNDSFLEQGVVNRFRIAVDGFVGIATHFYGPESIETQNVRLLLRNELSLLSFFYARDRTVESPVRENRAELDRIFAVCYGGSGFSNWLARMLYHLPVSGYRCLKSIYKVARAPWRWLHLQMKGNGRA